MDWPVIIALLLAAHFALTATFPGKAGKAAFYWPFAKDSNPRLNIFGSFTQPVTLLLSITAGACLLASVASVFGWLIPAGWFHLLAGLGTIASALLYLLYISRYSLIPLAIDAFLLWGVFVWQWTVVFLSGK
jgi:hypothetical protein